MNITIQHTKASKFIGSPEDIVVANVEREGVHFSFSRYWDEENWYCDSVILANGMPHFVHGTGNRSVLKQIAAPDIANAIEAIVD